MSERFFIGLIPPDNLLDLYRPIHDYFSGLNVRYVNKLGLHITLVPPFLGERAEVISSLDNLELPEEIVVEYNSLGLGSNIANPSLVWLKGDEFPATISDLRKSIYKILGMQMTSKFLLHTTFLRFDPKIKQEVVERISQINIQFPITGFCKGLGLYRSLPDLVIKNYETVWIKPFKKTT
jgi:2'-5' RNA ligase